MSESLSRNTVAVTSPRAAADEPAHGSKDTRRRTCSDVEHEPFLRDRKCKDCPFHETGPGRYLRRTLTRGRWKSILKSLIDDAHFICHETTIGTGDGSYQICRGGHDWQIENRGSPSVLFRILKLMPQHYPIFQEVARRGDSKGEEDE